VGDGRGWCLKGLVAVFEVGLGARALFMRLRGAGARGFCRQDCGGGGQWALLTRMVLGGACRSIQGGTGR